MKALRRACDIWFSRHREACRRTEDMASGLEHGKMGNRSDSSPSAKESCKIKICTAVWLPYVCLDVCTECRCCINRITDSLRARITNVLLAFLPGTSSNHISAFASSCADVIVSEPITLVWFRRRRLFHLKHHPSINQLYDAAATAIMDEDDNRLFVFSRPHWLNNANTRTAGIYFSGALVRSECHGSFFAPTANHRPAS